MTFLATLFWSLFSGVRAAIAPVARPDQAHAALLSARIDRAIASFECLLALWRSNALPETCADEPCADESCAGEPRRPPPSAKHHYSVQKSNPATPSPAPRRKAPDRRPPLAHGALSRRHGPVCGRARSSPIFQKSARPPAPPHALFVPFS